MLKSTLVMTLVGTGLFTGTVVGLLGIQGRLNFDGTRGMPVLEHFFAPPGGEGHDGSEGSHAGEQDVAQATEDRYGRLEGLGREQRLPREIGPTVPPAQGAEDAPPVGRPEAEAEHAAESAAEGAPERAQDEEAREFAHRAESLMGQDQYRRGKLFRFPRLESGMSVDELDEVLASVEQMRGELQRRRAALDQREADLNAREADIEDRQRAVLEKMREVLQQRSVLEEEIARFQKTYTLVRGDEKAQYRRYADTLDTLAADKASQIILQMWKTEEGRDRAVKILTLMSREATEEIFGVLSAEQTQSILDRLSRAAVEEKK